MSKLDDLIERARALPEEDQEALADEMLDWLDAPPPPENFGADGSDEELARRVEAWRANPRGVSAIDLHERLKRSPDKR